MQNIDFGRIYRNKPVPASSREQPSSVGGSSKTTVIVSIAVICFIAGLISGMQYQKVKITRQIEEGATKPVENNQKEVKVSNVAPDEKASQETEEKNQVKVNAETIKELDKDTYIIGKSFRDKNKAYKIGLGLKKKGLPVFASQNGNRMNLYVGPIKGRAKANQMFSQAKRFPGFNGAILYKK